MNPTDRRHPWSRLVAAARSAPDDRDPAAPFGFSTRVAALALSAPPRASFSLMFERLSWRALGVACLLMLASVIANYSAITRPPDEEVTMRDPIAEVLELES
ncbi:MAG TPA: hypothetical protein VMC06_07300 [Opitutaceae bacterium]|nr:hypothetical protein [Opitutaceae bacterium]